jgi:integrase
MGRPRKEKPNHGEYFDVKKTIGHKLNGDPIRKDFYSKISRSDASRQGDKWIIAHKVAEQTGKAFIEKNVTFSKWAQKWLEVYKKPNVDGNTYHLTYEQNVNNHLIPYFGKADIKSIKPIDVQEFFDKNSHYSDSVLKKLHMCLNGIFETAIENDICLKNPVKHISIKSKRKKNVKHVYSDKQIDKVKALCKLRMPEVYVLLCTGVRRGELLGFEWTDFNAKGKCISVNRALADVQNGVKKEENQRLQNLVVPGIKENPPKWNSYRTIPLDNGCVSLIDSLPRNGKYIFPYKGGDPQSPNTWSQKLKRCMIEMHKADPDIPVLSAHELRHTFGTMLRRHGVDIYTIQKVMGHKDIKMTSEIYVHNELDTLRKGLKLGTGVVQASHGRKYHIKRIIKRPH